MAKPILSLKKKPIVELKTEEALASDITVNPLTIVEVVEWDYTPEEDFQPRQRKRRKDKHVEQYRKEARWQ
ncbi:hypothetical protein D3C84_1019620 [compost metagenome]